MKTLKNILFSITAIAASSLIINGAINPVAYAETSDFSDDLSAEGYVEEDNTGSASVVIDAGSGDNEEKTDDNTDPSQNKIDSAVTDLKESDTDAENTLQNKKVLSENEKDNGYSDKSGGVSSTNSTGVTGTKNFTGFIKKDGSYIYYNKGKISTVKTDIVQGTINGVNAWYYIENGKAVLSHNGVDHNINGWWYVKKGKVDFSYNGFAKNKNGWWYIENGKVTFNRNDVIYGKVKKEYAWWNVKGSKVIFNESIEQNINGWWYIKDGKVDFTKTSVEQNHSGWWYVKNGKVDFSYTGLAPNQNGWWYVENGRVNYNYTGDAENENGIWRVENSKVNFKYNIATFENGKWSGYVNGRKDPKAAVVAHASVDEKGTFWGGQAGDQTGREVFCRTWNDHPWEYVIRAKTTAMAEKIAYAMERAVKNDNIGYDMGQRNTLYFAASKIGWDPGKVTGKVESDCSSLVTVAAIYAGVPRNVLYQNNNSSVTSNLRIRLKSTGLFDVYSSEDYTKSSEKLKRGDILIEEGEHTAVVVKILEK